jgi:AraC-like DNA-binding protein
MCQRATLLNGSLDLKSTAEQGSSIILHIQIIGNKRSLTWNKMKRAKLILYKKDIEKLEAVKDYITANLEKDLRIEVLSASFNMSKSALQRHFFAYEAVPLHVYILECRMEKAQELLRNHSLTILEISLKVGFNGHSAFSRTFIQYFGYTPQHFSKVCG